MNFRNCKEAALFYASLGWLVIPLKPKGKDPLTAHGKDDGSKDPDQIARWWRKNPDANVGIVCGAMSGIVVLDLDEHGESGSASIRKLAREKNVCIDQDTPSTITGSGGSHIIYRYDYDRPVGCPIGLLPGVDIRGEGSYIVAPPSVHPNGNVYDWEYEPDEFVIKDLPEPLYELIEAHEAQRRFEKFELPEKVESGGRNKKMFEYASSLRSNGADEAELREKMGKANKERFVPPLSFREMDKILGSVLRFPPGNQYAEAKKAAQEAPADPPKAKKVRTLKKADELMGKDLPEPKVFIGVDSDLPLLVEGTCILSAKPKLGKSWLALAMCIAVARGDDFLGYKTNKCSVLYLDLETSEQLQQKRMRKALNGSKCPSNFYLDTETDNIDNGFIDQINAYLEQDPELGVIIVDVFQIVRSKATNSKESEYEHVYRDITPLNKIAQEKHVAIVLVCHDRKEVNEDDPFANILGSTGLQGAATQMMVMFKKRKQKGVHLSVKGKTIDGLPELDIELDNGQWNVLENANASEETHERVSDYLSSPIRSAAVEILAKSGKWEGRCTPFIDAAAACGIGLEEGPKEIGAFFSKYKGLFLKYDNVMVESILKGNASRIYRLYYFQPSQTISTISPETENPFI